MLDVNQSAVVRAEKTSLDGRCYCHTIYGEKKAWGCGWWVEWTHNVMEAHFLGQKFQVFYFNGQVGQGEIDWKDCAKHSLLRDRVMDKRPKDEAGWPKTMSAEEDAHFLETLSEEEQRCMVGLGGSQKAALLRLPPSVASDFLFLLLSSPRVALPLCVFICIYACVCVCKKMS